MGCVPVQVLLENCCNFATCIGKNAARMHGERNNSLYLCIENTKKV